LPFAIGESSAANHIRVGFAHKQRQEHKDIYAASQANEVCPIVPCNIVGLHPLSVKLAQQGAYLVLLQWVCCGEGSCGKDDALADLGSNSIITADL